VHSTGAVLLCDDCSKLTQVGIIGLPLTEALNGKLLLVTNIEGLSAADVVARYKALAEIERGFQALKSEIKIGAVYHRLLDRIRGHASLCFVALIRIA